MQRPSFQLAHANVDRQLRREQNSLFNCVQSIQEDSLFVNEIRSLYPTLPLFANLRCGLWYASEPDGTCYFKSTDGHCGKWSFSVTRLNLHVAEACVQHGGVVILDATRRGKRFPDSLSKTIPIWAAVINHALQIQHQRATDDDAAPDSTSTHCADSKPAGDAPSGGAEHGAPAADAPQAAPAATADGDSPDAPFYVSDSEAEDARRFWAGLQGSFEPREGAEYSGPALPRDDRVEDCSGGESAAPRSTGRGHGGVSAGWGAAALLPLWVPATEAAQIEARVPEWAAELLAARPDLGAVLRGLRKPLRPLWVSQESLIWTNHVAAPSALPFTPVILLSASLPALYQRRTVTRALRARTPDARVGGRGSGGAPSESSSSSGSEDEDPIDGRGSPQRHSYSFVYVPGAGDDEETWARGLTPALFWQHADQLLSCGPSDIEAAVARLVASNPRRAAAQPSPQQLLAQRPSGDQPEATSPSRRLERGSGGAEAAPQPAPAGPSPPDVGAGCQGRASGERAPPRRPPPARINADTQRFAPLGSRAADPAAVRRVGPAVFLLGATGVALASVGAAEAALDSVATAVGAVLNVSAQDSPELRKAMGGAAAGEGRAPSGLPRGSRHSASAAVCAQSDCSSHPCEVGGGFVRCVQHVSAVARVAEGGDAPRGAAADMRPGPRNDSDEQSRSSQAGDAGLRAASGADGRDASVCESSSSSGLLGLVQAAYCWRPLRGSKFERNALASALPELLEFMRRHLLRGARVLVVDDDGTDICVCVAVAALQAFFRPEVGAASALETRFDASATASRPAQALTKTSVRQQLARLCHAYPHANPTRGNLKQVFNSLLACGEDAMSTLKSALPPSS